MFQSRTHRTGSNVECTEPREEELFALYRWYRDWSHTAHAVVARKDYLVALGLADRRKTRRPEEAQAKER